MKSMNILHSLYTTVILQFKMCSKSIQNYTIIFFYQHLELDRGQMHNRTPTCPQLHLPTISNMCHQIRLSIWVLIFFNYKQTHRARGLLELGAPCVPSPDSFLFSWQDWEAILCRLKGLHYSCLGTWGRVMCLWCNCYQTASWCFSNNGSGHPWACWLLSPEHKASSLGHLCSKFAPLHLVRFIRTLAAHTLIIPQRAVNSNSV